MTCPVIVVIPDATQADVLDEMTAAMATWAGAKMKLIKEPITPARNATLAEYDAAEADYTGYASVAITWQAAARGSDGIVSADTQAAQFLASGTAASNTIYGGYVTDMAEMVLLGTFTLPDPIVMGVDLLQAVDVQARFNLTNNIGGA